MRTEVKRRSVEAKGISVRVDNEYVRRFGGSVQPMGFVRQAVKVRGKRREGRPGTARND